MKRKGTRLCALLLTAAMLLSLLPVAAFPFTIWLAVGMIGGSEPGPVNPLLLIVLFWLLGLAGAAVTLWQSIRGRWQGRRLALASMIIKLLHIQSYVALFFIALSGVFLLFLLPMLVALVWVLDVMTIILSGLVGLAGVLRCRAEGRLTTKAAIVNGILQFVFCADVFSAVWVYRNSKEVFLP